LTEQRLCLVAINFTAGIKDVLVVQYQLKVIEIYTTKNR